jgi:hypothetical protein
VKKGKPSTHPVRGDELRALRKHQRETRKSHHSGGLAIGLSSMPTA